MKIRYTPEAMRLQQRIFDRIAQLAAGEIEGPESVLRSGSRVRSWPVKPLRIYYQREADLFLVVRVYHQKRRPITR